MRGAQFKKKSQGQLSLTPTLNVYA